MLMAAFLSLASVSSKTVAFQSSMPSTRPSPSSSARRDYVGSDRHRSRCQPSPIADRAGPNDAFHWSRSYASNTNNDQSALPITTTPSIHSLLEAGRLDDAAAGLRDRTVAGDVPASTYHAVIEACCAGGGYDPRKKSKGKRQQRTQRHGKDKKDEDRMELAEELLRSMKEGGVPVTAHSYEMIAAGFARRGRWRDASRVLLTMEEACSENPSLNVYQTVLASLARARQPREMDALLTSMRRRGVRPAVSTYNSLLKICASDRVPRWREALSLLSQCQREPGVDPDIITYTTAMRACARGGRAGKAMELFGAARDMGLKLDVYIYTTAMDACAKGGGTRWKKALSLMDEMRDEGIEPNEVTYGVAVMACGNGGKWERALELLDRMRERGLSINAITYNSAIAALSKAARMESKQHAGDEDTSVLWRKALSLIKCMEDEGIRRDSFTFSSAISTCGATGRWEEAVNLIEDMKRDRIKPNKVAYTSAITACANSRQWEPAFALFNRMKDDGLRPDIVAYNALIGAGMTAEKPIEVFDMWLEMCGGSQPDADGRGGGAISPDIVTLTEVIATLDVASGKVNRERADEVFAEAVRRGLILRKDSLDTVREVDLSTMSMPVARAACRFIFRRMAEQNGRRGSSSAEGEDDGDDLGDLSLITGANRMREHIRAVLRDELKPGVYCVVPKLEQGTLVVKEMMLRNYIDGQEGGRS